MIPALVFFGILFLLALWIVLIYNGLVTARNLYKNAFAQIDVQLTRRHDLIPNLVETAKGYLKHERETLEAVIAARDRAATAVKKASDDPGEPGVMQRLNGAESALAGAMSRFMAVAEQYPDLKANQTMGQLMEELTSTENKVAFARQAYNDAVMSYNNTRETFPNVLFSGPFNFQAAELFEIEEPSQRQAPEVSFT